MVSEPNYSPNHLHATELAARSRYLAVAGPESAMLVGTKEGQPRAVHVYRLWAIDDMIAVPDHRESIRRNWPEGRYDAIDILIRSVWPDRADSVVELLWDDDLLPYQACETGTSFHLYGERLWRRVDPLVFEHDFHSVPEVDPAVARVSALAVRADIIAAQGGAASGIQTARPNAANPPLPRFYEIPDRSHLTRHDRMSIGDFHASSPHLSVADARELGTALAADPWLTAAAIDDVLYRKVEELIRPDLWARVARSCQGEARATAAVLSALNAWRWALSDATNTVEIGDAAASAAPGLALTRDLQRLLATGVGYSQLMPDQNFGFLIH